MFLHPESRHLVEHFDITLPDGTKLRGSVYRTNSRRCGRRILVKDFAGSLLFDSDECYDLGNALFALDEWLAKEESRRAFEALPVTIAFEAAKVADPDYVPTLADALRHPAEFVAGMIEEPMVIHHGIPDFTNKPLPR